MKRNPLAIAAAVLGWAGLGVAVACALGAAASGFGNRIGFWDYRAGFTILRWSVYVAAGAGVASLLAGGIAAARRSVAQLGVSVIGLVLAVAVIFPAWSLQRAAAKVPRIHDITTDTEDPPRFVALLAVRQKARNGAAYGGPKLAAQQKAGYPDIAPVQLGIPPAQAFDRALAVAQRMGWDIVAADKTQGRIEATATTFWFGFKDDVVIRITAAANGSRLDIRSMSRVGRSDLGANAARIRAFIGQIRAAS